VPKGKLLPNWESGCAKKNRFWISRFVFPVLLRLCGKSFRNRHAKLTSNPLPDRI